MNCPHCHKPVFTMSKDGTKLKAPTSMMVIHKSTEVEINCGHCKMGVLIPLKSIPGETALKKAHGPSKFFVPRGA